MSICVFMCGFVWEFLAAARLQTLGAGCLATKLTRVVCILLLNRQIQGETIYSATRAQNIQLIL